VLTHAALSSDSLFSRPPNTLYKDTNEYLYDSNIRCLPISLLDTIACVALMKSTTAHSGDPQNFNPTAISSLATIVTPLDDKGPQVQTYTASMTARTVPPMYKSTQTNFHSVQDLNHPFIDNIDKHALPYDVRSHSQTNSVSPVSIVSSKSETHQPTNSIVTCESNHLVAPNWVVIFPSSLTVCDPCQITMHFRDSMHNIIMCKSEAPLTQAASAAARLHGGSHTCGNAVCFCVVCVMCVAQCVCVQNDPKVHSQGIFTHNHH